MRHSMIQSTLITLSALLLMGACSSNSSKETDGSSSATPEQRQTNANAGVNAGPDTSKIDPCVLVTKAEAAEILGELKGGSESSTGLHNEKRCGYSNMKGNHVSFGVYSADLWEMKRTAAEGLETTALEGLGDEAFAVRRGTENQIYVRSRGVVLEVNSSGGREIARRIAEKASSRL